MIQRIIDSKNFLAFVFAGATGMALWFTVPFPEGNVFLQLMAVKASAVFAAIKYSYAPEDSWKSLNSWNVGT